MSLLCIVLGNDWSWCDAKTSFCIQSLVTKTMYSHSQSDLQNKISFNSPYTINNSYFMEFLEYLDQQSMLVVVVSFFVSFNSDVISTLTQDHTENH